MKWSGRVSSPLIQMRPRVRSMPRFARASGHLARPMSAVRSRILFAPASSSGIIRAIASITTIAAGNARRSIRFLPLRGAFYRQVLAQPRFRRASSSPPSRHASGKLRSHLIDPWEPSGNVASRSIQAIHHPPKLVGEIDLGLSRLELLLQICDPEERRRVRSPVVPTQICAVCEFDHQQADDITQRRQPHFAKSCLGRAPAENLRIRRHAEPLVSCHEEDHRRRIPDNALRIAQCAFTMTRNSMRDRIQRDVFWLRLGSFDGNAQSSLAGSRLRNLAHKQAYQHSGSVGTSMPGRIGPALGGRRTRALVPASRACPDASCRSPMSTPP